MKWKRTYEREEALKLYQDKILEQLEPLVKAQFSVAKGTQIMVARDWIIDPKTHKRTRAGRFVRITSTKEVLELLNSELEEGDDYYIVFTQDPNPKAIEDLMARAFGKPKEQIEVEHKGKMVILDK